MRKEPGGSFLLGVSRFHYEESTKMSIKAMRNNGRNTVDFCGGKQVYVFEIYRVD
jgi:hypothetical protein